MLPPDLAGGGRPAGTAQGAGSGFPVPALLHTARDKLESFPLIRPETHSNRSLSAGRWRIDPTGPRYPRSRPNPVITAMIMRGKRTIP
jgi:hypothetical protein